MLFSLTYFIGDRILIVLYRYIYVIFGIYCALRFVNLMLVYTVNLEYGIGLNLL